MDNKTQADRTYKLSIIIPVYNLEKYLRRCLESVLGYEDLRYEIILINDGSTDDSATICDQYAAKYPQIKVIHKANEGASVTRNTGMRIAQGEYLMFIDGDDFLEPQVLKDIVKGLDGDTELYTYHFYDYYEGEDSKVPIRHLEGNSLYDRSGKITKKLFYSVPALPMPWLYMIQGEYLHKNGLYMKAGILDEDEEWSARVFANLRTAKVLELYAYNYRRDRSDSLSNKRSSANLLADLAILGFLKEEAQQEKYDKRQRRILYNKGCDLLKRSIKESGLLRKEQQEDLRKQQRGYRRMLFGATRADTITYLLSLILGLTKAYYIVQWMGAMKAKHDHSGGFGFAVRNKKKNR